MRVLLTGATGFIGAHLVRRLIGEGHDLSIIVRERSNLEMLSSLQAYFQVSLYDGSYSSLVTAIEAKMPDVVIHVASLFLAQHSAHDVARLIDSNITFPTQLLEAMSEVGIRHLVNTGTSWQHFQNHLYSPVNLYAATKQAFESLLAYYVEARDFKVITLKLFDTYGPGDTRPKLFSMLRKVARDGETLRMSPGEQLLDLVYIDDVLDAYVIALGRFPRISQVAETYAVSNDVRLSLRDVVQIYAEIVGRPVNVEWGGLPYRPREVMEPWSEYQTLPDWKARVALRDGILRMEKDRNIGGLRAESLS